MATNKTSSHTGGVVHNAAHATKHRGPHQVSSKMNHATTPKGSKGASKLQKMQKNNQADQPPNDEKDLMEDDMAAGPGSGYESLNTFMKAKTYKDQHHHKDKDKVDHNTQKNARESRRTFPLNPGGKSSSAANQVNDANDLKRKNAKKDQSPSKTTGAYHSGNNQDPPHFQQQR